eukprot:356503-Chlamydomonas_euryale.AAC.1
MQCVGMLRRRPPKPVNVHERRAGRSVEQGWRAAALRPLSGARAAASPRRRRAVGVGSTASAAGGGGAVWAARVKSPPSPRACAGACPRSWQKVRGSR